MANWKWMFPPRPCSDQCRCYRQTWRSTYSGGNWGPVVLVTQDEDVECGLSTNWQLFSSCVAERTIYTRCVGPDVSPGRPTIAAPDCSSQTPQPCIPCWPDRPQFGQFVLPGPWGNLVEPAPGVGNPRRGYEPGATCPPIGLETCSHCDDMPTITFVVDFGDTSYYAGLCTGFSYYRCHPLAQCGSPLIACTTPAAPCGWKGGARYLTTFPCCTYQFNPRPPFNTIWANRNYPVGVCAEIYPGLVGGETECRIVLEIVIQQGSEPNLNFPYDFGTQRSVYLSAPVASIVSSTVTMTRDCIEGFGGTNGFYCDNSFPSSIDITFGPAV